MVTIQPLSERHSQTSFAWRNNPSIWRNTFNKPNIKVTPEIELNWIKKVLKNKDEKRFAIYYYDNYVGNIYLTLIKNQTAYLGIFIGDSKFMNKGIGKKASLLILKFGREQLQLKEVFLRVKKGNIAGIKLYKKVGFKIIDEIDDYYKMKVEL